MLCQWIRLLKHFQCRCISSVWERVCHVHRSLTWMKLCAAFGLWTVLAAMWHVCMLVREVCRTCVLFVFLLPIVIVAAHWKTLCSVLNLLGLADIASWCVVVCLYKSVSVRNLCFWIRFVQLKLCVVLCAIFVNKSELWSTLICTLLFRSSVF